MWEQKLPPTTTRGCGSEGGREGVAVVSSHNKGRRQSCSSRAASPLTSGSHAHSLLRPLPVCVVFFSPFQKIGGAFSSVSAAERGRGRNAVAQHTISASHIHSAFVHMCACPTAEVLYQPRPPPGSGVGEGGERERERERVTAAVYTCFASSQIGGNWSKVTDGGRRRTRTEVGFA